MEILKQSKYLTTFSNKLLNNNEDLGKRTLPRFILSFLFLSKIF